MFVSEADKTAVWVFYVIKSDDTLKATFKVCKIDSHVAVILIVEDPDLHDLLIHVAPKDPEGSAAP